MCDRTMACLAVLVGVAALAAADVVVLSNGDRIEGEIISQTPTEVQIRRANKSGNIRFVDRIDRTRIAQIERDQAQEGSPSSAPAEPAQTPEAASQPVALTEADRKELLATALAQWEKENHAAVGIALSRLINGSAPDELARISRQIEDKARLSLGDMAAEAHLQAAITRARGQSLSLSYVTDYEKPYLAPRLIDAYNDALKKPVTAAPPPAPRTRTRVRAEPGHNRDEALEGQPPLAPSGSPVPQTQPARSFVIAHLLDDPAGFDGNREESLALARHIRYTLSLLAARTRYDPQCKSDPHVRDEVKKDRDRLMALQKAVTAKASTAAPAGREARSVGARAGFGGPGGPPRGGAPGEPARDANRPPPRHPNPVHDQIDQIQARQQMEEN